MHASDSDTQTYDQEAISQETEHLKNIFERVELKDLLDEYNASITSSSRISADSDEIDGENCKVKQSFKEKIANFFKTNYTIPSKGDPSTMFGGVM
ncbi:hypothetical protein SOPP22_14965 [Shewanella sp. OPT22]|nr:hypothetical protein SOPP22_14965 [Shewanella sp. OPT22]